MKILLEVLEDFRRQHERTRFLADFEREENYLWNRCRKKEFLGCASNVRSFRFAEGAKSLVCR